MDTTACPSGYANDAIWMLVSEIHSDCSTPLALYCVLIGATVIAKITITALMARAWRERHQRILSSGDQRRIAAEKKRLPIIPANLILSSIAYVVLFILTAANVANSYNGIPYMLYGFGWTLCLCLILIYLPKILELASKLAPFAFRHGSESIKIMNTFQRVLNACAVVALFAQAIIFVVFVPIFPGSSELIRAGLALQAIVPTCFACVITYQVERVIAMVKRMAVKTEHVQDQASFVAHRKLVQDVIWKLRMQQFIIVLVSVSVATMSCLQVALILPTYWFIFFINMCADVLVNCAFLFTSARFSTPATSNIATPAGERKAMSSAKSSSKGPTNTPVQPNAIIPEVC